MWKTTIISVSSLLIFFVLLCAEWTTDPWNPLAAQHCSSPHSLPPSLLCLGFEHLALQWSYCQLTWRMWITPLSPKSLLKKPWGGVRITVNKCWAFFFLAFHFNFPLCPWNEILTICHLEGPLHFLLCHILCPFCFCQKTKAGGDYFFSEMDGILKNIWTERIFWVSLTDGHSKHGKYSKVFMRPG